MATFDSLDEDLSGTPAADLSADSSGTEGDDATPPLYYATVAQFVEEFLVEMLWFDTSTHARIWCPQWWRHPAAIVRLDALHSAFENLRLDPALGMSNWLLLHAEPHMSMLTDPNGPFKGCSVTKGHDAARERRLPVDPSTGGAVRRRGLSPARPRLEARRPSTLSNRRRRWTTTSRTRPRD